MGRKVVGKGGRGNRMKREEEENVRETRGKKRGRGGKYRGRGKEREERERKAGRTVSIRGRWRTCTGVRLLQQRYLLKYLFRPWLQLPT